MALWMVRSGRHGEGDDLALSRGVVGIGWPRAGDLSEVTTTDDLRERLIETHPDAKPSTISNWVGQVDAFQRRMTDGDLVALPLKSEPAVAFGQVAGSYRYVPDAPEPMRHQRPVRWLREVPRDAIDQDILYSLGAFLTVCRIQRNDAEVRIRALLSRPDGAPLIIPSPSTEDLPAVDTDRQPDTDLDELSRDQVRRRIRSRFAGHDLARLVDHVLKAQGWFTDLSPAGPDGGVDILAGEGGMGFDGARLAVQVKSGGGIVDAPTLRELQGVMSNFGADRGLMVSWSGFTKTARTEARRLFFQLRLWDADDLVTHIQEVYDRLPQDVQAELPLRRIWTLVPEGSD